MRKTLTGLLCAALSVAAAITLPNSVQVVSGAAAVLGSSYSVILGSDPRALLPSPDSVVTDSSGRVYVSETFANRVVYLDPGATSWSVLVGSQGAGTALDQVSKPRGLALDAANNLYVADTANNRVLKFAPGSSTATVAAGSAISGSGLDQLSSPWSVAVGSDGELYVGDLGNYRVLRFNTLGQGSMGTLVAGGNGAGSGMDQLTFPISIAVQPGPDPDLYVADYNSNRVMKWVQGAASGTVYASTPSSGSLFNPSSVAFVGTDLYVAAEGSHRVFVKHAGGSFDPALGDGTSQYALSATRSPVGLAPGTAGTLYVLEKGRLTKRTTDGASSELVMGYSSNPALEDDYLTYLDDIAVDSSGYLYTAEGNKVRKWAPGSSIGTVVAGGNGSGSALNQLSGITGIAVDSAGNVFVSEGSNNRVTKWAPGATSGVVVAGGNGAGSALNQLSSPKGIAVSPTGDLYIADGSNNRVVIWSPGATEGVHLVGSLPAGSSDTSFYWVTDVALSPTGDVYMTDFYGQRVVVWNPGTSKLDEVATGSLVGTPEFLTIDQNNGLYVGSASKSSVSYFPLLSGTPYRLFEDGLVGEVAGLATDSEGRVWFGDSHYHTVIATRIRGALGITDPGPQTVGNPAFSVMTSGVTSMTSPQVFASPAEVCSASAGMVTPISPGTCTITVQIDDSLLYSSSTASMDVVVLAATTTTTTTATTPPTTTTTTTTVPTTTTPPQSTTTTAPSSPTTTTQPTPSYKNIYMKCSTSKSRKTTCTIRKPSSISSKSKLSYKMACTSTTGTVSKSVSTAARTIYVGVQLKKGSWSCVITTSYKGTSYRATWTRKIL